MTNRSKSSQEISGICEGRWTESLRLELWRCCYCGPCGLHSLVSLSQCAVLHMTLFPLQLLHDKLHDSGRVSLTMQGQDQSGGFQGTFEPFLLTTNPETHCKVFFWGGSHLTFLWSCDRPSVAVLTDVFHSVEGVPRMYVLIYLFEVFSLFSYINFKHSQSYDE